MVVNDQEPHFPATQYEDIRDNGFEHLNYEAEDDERARRRLRDREQRTADNLAAENSIIKEITCINFMCHKKLHVELGPLINFVVGMNGSGKSAVLTAITLVLAGKTASTMRGSKMGSFIKSGEENGILIIKLKNEGDDAYQPELFGEEIIVERHFSRSGNNTFKMKTSTGRLISNKKSDIDELVEYFQLQVDNPMTVLNQEMAKKFLTRSTPAAKYDFFIEGVQLKALDADYKVVSDTCDSLDVKLKDFKANVKVLKKTADAAKAKADMVQKHGGIRREARRFRNQLAWAQVEAEEEKFRRREEDILNTEAKIQEYERMAEGLDIELQQADDHLERATEAERVTRQELEPLQAELEAATSIHRAALAEVSAHKKHVLEVKESMKSGMAKVKQVEADIKAEEERLVEINGGSHARMQAAIEEAKRLAAAAKSAHKESENQLPELEKRREQVASESQAVEQSLRSKAAEVETARGRLDDLKQRRGDVMAGFDRQMPRLMDMIRRDKGFREHPVGPIGLHITLLDGSWALLVEKAIGSNLGGFVVTSKSDQVRLNNLIKDSGVKSPTPVLIGNHHAFNIAGHEPDPEYTTLLRVLNIENELIQRQLIIAHGIEQSVLFKDLESAQRFMYEGARPRNVKQCLVLNKNKPGWGHRLGFGTSGANARDLAPIYPVKGAPRLKTDAESQIQNQQALVRGLETEKNELDNKRRQAQQQIKNATSAVHHHMKTIQNLKIDSQRADEKAEALQIELERDIVEDGRLEMYRENLKIDQQNLAIDQETYGNTRLEEVRLNEVAAGRKSELDAVNNRVTDHEAKINKATLKTRQKAAARSTVLPRKNLAMQHVAEYQAAKRALEEKRDRVAATLVTYNAQATQVCPRVAIDPGQTKESLERTFNKLKQQVDSYNRQQGGTDEAILNQALATAEAQQVAENALQDITELHQLLKQAFAKRMSMFRDFQRHISARSRINFNYLLSERAFRGTLTIDHRAKALDVHVEPDETTKKGSGRQTKTLSGGEKSFSNICLLLALWEAMGQPLRCLDEFDVFMDDVNRDVSTKMIVGSTYLWLRLC